MISWLKKIIMKNERREIEVSFESWVNDAHGANLLDHGWAQFLMDGNPGWLKLMDRAASEAPSIIFTSERFGPDVRTYQQALHDYHSDSHADFAVLVAALSKVSNTYRGQVASLTLLSSDITEYPVEALSAGTQLNGLTVTEFFLSSCRHVLNASTLDKATLLASGQFPDVFHTGAQARLHGTLLVDVPFMGVTFGERRALCISLQSPLDAFYFPAERIIVRASELRFSCIDRLNKLFNWILRHPHYYHSFWKQPATSTLRYLVRDKRPYHVLLDELSGRYELEEAGFTLPTLFFERASFDEDAKTINFATPESNIFPDLLISNHRRADKDAFSSRYFTYLKKQAAHRYGENTSGAVGTLIWLSISGGEKRRWFEEREALVAFIQWCRQQFGPCHFYVDGWTSPLVRTNADNHQIRQHNEIWHTICAQADVKKEEYTSFIGAGALRKIWGASQARFFISCAGTPSVWPSLIGRVPGVVHNSVSMIRRVQNTYFPDNVVRVPDHHIEDINEIGNLIRWDKYSYSIHVEEVLRCAKEASGQTCRTPEQFYTALVSAAKRGDDQQFRSLQALCRERLETYRNLQHILTSSAFFGAPEVCILHEEEGNFRIIDCNVDCESDVVFVTFGSEGSHVDHTPFSHALLKDAGFKHFHVAQARRTSYQHLSIEDFGTLVGALVETYPYRFTYGTGLGGYAALYYSSAINANAIAGAPRLPLHPENLQFKGELWRPGSHWDETDYKHAPLLEVVSESCPPPFIIYDPCDPIDLNFVQHCIEPCFPVIRFLELPGTERSPLKQLVDKGQLESVIHDHVVSVQGN